MPATATFIKRVGDTAATVVITPVGERSLGFDLYINGAHRDSDTVEFVTGGARDRNFGNVVREYLGSGYTKVR